MQLTHIDRDSEVFEMQFGAKSRPFFTIIAPS